MIMSEVVEYIQRAKLLGIIPNFWLSEDYLAIQDAQLRSNGKVIWVEEGEWAIFPPLPIDSNELKKESCPPLKVWSDFENLCPGDNAEFLDWEYTYAADNFNAMDGKKWSTFRKNSRKWIKGRDWDYTHHPAPNICVEMLLLKWLESKPVGEVVHDQDSMVWFLFESKRRGFLYDKDKLVGVNVWDSNDPLLMYRYCVTDPDEPYLNEFARLLFYRSVPGRLVIDGGCLGNPGLERFKDKLNPVKKRAMYSRAI